MQVGCQFCKKITKNKLCACQWVYYCSVSCQRQDWNQHKEICKFIRKLGNKENPTQMLKNEQMFLTNSFYALQTQVVENTKICPSYSTFIQLWQNVYLSSPLKIAQYFVTIDYHEVGKKRQVKQLWCRWIAFLQTQMQVNRKEYKEASSIMKDSFANLTLKEWKISDIKLNKEAKELCVSQPPEYFSLMEKASLKLLVKQTLLYSKSKVSSNQLFFDTKLSSKQQDEREKK